MALTLSSVDVLLRIALEMKIKGYVIDLTQRLQQVNKPYSDIGGPETCIYLLEKIVETYHSAPSAINYDTHLHDDKRLNTSFERLITDLDLLKDTLRVQTDALRETYKNSLHSLPDKHALFQALNGFSDTSGDDMCSRISLGLRLCKHSQDELMTKHIHTLKSALQQYQSAARLGMKQLNLTKKIPSIILRLQTNFRQKSRTFSGLSQSTFHWKSASEQWLIPDKRPQKHNGSIIFDELIINPKLLKQLKSGKPLKQILYLNCYQITILCSFLDSAIKENDLQRMFPPKILSNTANQQDLYLSHSAELAYLYRGDEFFKKIDTKNIASLSFNKGDFITFDKTKHVVMATGVDDQIISFWKPSGSHNLELEITTFKALFEAKFASHTEVVIYKPSWLKSPSSKDFNTTFSFFRKHVNCFSTTVMHEKTPVI